MEEIIIIEKIGDYKREAKRFIKGLVKSKLFTSPENEMKVFIVKGEFDKKEKQGTITLVVQCPVSGMKADYNIMAPTRVYNRVEKSLFDGLVAQFAKMKNSLKLTIC